MQDPDPTKRNYFHSVYVDFKDSNKKPDPTGGNSDGVWKEGSWNKPTIKYFRLDQKDKPYYTVVNYTFSICEYGPYYPIGKYMYKN